MGTNYTKSTIASGFASTTNINNERTNIEDALDRSLSRYGDTPNQMEAELDMNSNRIINVGAPVAQSDAIRLQDITDDAKTATASATTITDSGAFYDSDNVEGAFQEVGNGSLADDGWRYRNTAVYSSGTVFILENVDLSSEFHVGRRAKAEGSATGTIYGTIDAVDYNSTNANDTTVTVVWDSGSLSNETLTVWVGQASALDGKQSISASGAAFRQSGTGAIPSSVNIKSRNALEVFDFLDKDQRALVLNRDTGAQSVSQVTSDIQNAIDAAIDDKRKLIINRGSYAVSGFDLTTIAQVSNSVAFGVTIEGEGMGTVFVPDGSASVLFDLDTGASGNDIQTYMGRFHVLGTSSSQTNTRLFTIGTLSRYSRFFDIRARQMREAIRWTRDQAWGTIWDNMDFRGMDRQVVVVDAGVSVITEQLFRGGYWDNNGVLGSSDGNRYPVIDLENAKDFKWFGTVIEGNFAGTLQIRAGCRNTFFCGVRFEEKLIDYDTSGYVHTFESTADGGTTFKNCDLTYDSATGFGLATVSHGVNIEGGQIKDASAANGNPFNVTSTGRLSIDRPVLSGVSIPRGDAYRIEQDDVSHKNYYGDSHFEGALSSRVNGITGATLDVSGRSILKTSNGSATTITDLTNGVTGQEVTVIIGDNNTTVDFTGTNLKGNGGADWSPALNDHMTCVTADGTTWHCNISDNSA